MNEKMFAVVRDTFPNGDISIFCAACYDTEAPQTNVHTDWCETIEEARQLKNELVEAEVYGHDGPDCKHARTN